MSVHVRVAAVPEIGVARAPTLHPGINTTLLSPILLLVCGHMLFGTFFCAFSAGVPMTVPGYDKNVARNVNA
jgi:hypothetical protein